MAFNIEMLLDQQWHCAVAVTVVSSSTKCSTYLIIAMTFDRFYSIIRPHKAASFNTVKRAKITIVGIALITSVSSIPHLFITSYSGQNCLVFVKGMSFIIGKIYYWADQIIGFILPFGLLLFMNSVIVRTLLTRSRMIIKRSQSQGPSYRQKHSQNGNTGQGQGESKGQSTKDKHVERQIIMMLLFVTFGFLILMIPSFGMSFYSLFVDYKSSPKSYADFYLLAAIGQKTYYTNFGINFFLYVISGQRFRNDLVRLFRLCFCRKTIHNEANERYSSSNTALSIVS